MKKTLSLIAFSLATFSINASPEAEKSEAAESLAVAMDLKMQMQAGFDAMRPTIEMQMKQFELDPNQSNELFSIYKNWYDNDIDHDALYQQMVGIYAEAFSVEELTQLTEFYQTPLGKKTLKELPEIAQRSVQAGMMEAQSKQQLLIEKLTPFFEEIAAQKEAAHNHDHGHDHAHDEVTQPLSPSDAAVTQ